jgi:5-methylcytosine-specific restriction endonuclease McrA
MTDPLKRIRHRLHSANLFGIRRARRYGRRADIIHVDDLLYKLRNEQRYLCVYCPRRIMFTFELEHKLALCNGGHHIIENIQFTCDPCNNSKGQKLTPQFTWNEARENARIDQELAPRIHNPNAKKRW